MNDGGVCRTAPATPGLLKNKTKNGQISKNIQTINKKKIKYIYGQTKNILNEEEKNY